MIFVPRSHHLFLFHQAPTNDAHNCNAWDLSHVKPYHHHHYCSTPANHCCCRWKSGTWRHDDPEGRGPERHDDRRMFWLFSSKIPGIPETFCVVLEAAQASRSCCGYIAVSFKDLCNPLSFPILLGPHFSMTGFLLVCQQNEQPATTFYIPNESIRDEDTFKNHGVWYFVCCFGGIQGIGFCFSFCCGQWLFFQRCYGGFSFTIFDKLCL